MILIMHIYLITGDSIRLIDEEIKKIIKDNTNVETFDLNVIDLESLLEEASYLSLFEEKRFMIVKNATMFGTEKINEKNNELLLKYLDNPNDNTVLIFTYNGKDAHEIILMYNVTLDDEDYKEEYHIVDNDNYYAKWINLDLIKSGKVILYPEEIKKYL